MKLNILEKLLRKGRKYPIRKDEFGMTRRAWVFRYFDQGMSPAQAADKAGTSVRNARRYKATWRKRSPNLETEYESFKIMRRKDPEGFQNFIELWSVALGMPHEEVLQRLSKPWGLKQLLIQQRFSQHQEGRTAELEVEVDVALEFVRVMKILGFTPDRVGEMIREFLRAVLKRRPTKEGADSTTLTTPPEPPSDLQNGDIRP